MRGTMRKPRGIGINGTRGEWWVYAEVSWRSSGINPNVDKNDEVVA